MKSAGSVLGLARGFAERLAEHVVFPQNPALDTADFRLHAGGPAAHDDGHVNAARDGKASPATAFRLADADDVAFLHPHRLPHRDGVAGSP